MDPPEMCGPYLKMPNTAPGTHEALSNTSFPNHLVHVHREAKMIKKNTIPLPAFGSWTDDHPFNKHVLCIMYWRALCWAPGSPRSAR